jgi:hypothetical protein
VALRAVQRKFVRDDLKKIRRRRYVAQRNTQNFASGADYGKGLIPSGRETSGIDAQIGLLSAARGEDFPLGFSL